MAPAREVLARASRKAAAAAVSIQWHQASATALPFESGTFQRVLSTLFFHHLRPADKLAAAREAHRVLQPGGEMHVADWGPPTSWLQRALFVPVQILDGFANTSPHVEGRLLGTFETAGFADVRMARRFSTAFGTVALYRMTRPVGVADDHCV